jgi:hypothetical protein
MNVNSASMMRERVEALFQGVRSVMRDNGRARSGIFTMEWSVALQEFWKVVTYCIFSIVFRWEYSMLLYLS